jgi:hypothetical protein
LGTVGIASRVQANDLVTENVVTSGNGARDGHSAAVVGGNEIVRCPFTRDVAAIDQTSLIDLEELEGGLVDLGAVTLAVGHVGDDRAVVALGPLSPLQLDGTTGLDLCGDRTGAGLLVTDNVGARVAGGVDEAKVGGSLSPSDVLRDLGLVVVVIDDEATVVGAINNST